MCPGGYVVNASSEEHRLAVNGMSYSDRGGSNANSAIIVSVTPEDFKADAIRHGVLKDADGKEDVLSGVRFQERLEERAWKLGNGKIPQQLFGDYCKNRPSVSYGAFESTTKGDSVLCNLRGLLPEELEESFIEGMHHFPVRFRNLTVRMRSFPVSKAVHLPRCVSCVMNHSSRISAAFTHAGKAPDMQVVSCLRQWTA